MAKKTKLEELIEEINSNYKEKMFQEITLPSGKVIHVRPMTGEDEAILATPKLQSICHQTVLKRCAKENVDLLSEEDRDWLTVWIVGVSYGPKKKIKIKCPEDHVFEQEIDLDSITCSKDIKSFMVMCPIDCAEFEINIKDQIWKWAAS